MFQTMFQTFSGRVYRFSRSLLWLPIVWMTTCAIVGSLPGRFVVAFPLGHKPGLPIVWKRPTPYYCHPFSPTRRLDNLIPGQRFPSQDRVITTSATIPSSTRCHLFFRKSQDQATPQHGRNARIDPSVLLELESTTSNFPFTVALPDNSNNNHQKVLTLRFMTPKDLHTILALCIDEFGCGKTTTLFEFPWNDWSRVLNWWDRLTFEPSISLALLAKMNANRNYNQRKCTPIQDPAILVLSQRTNMDYSDDGNEQEQVIGMVEISLQPPNPNRNPPSFPIPLWIKAWWWHQFGQGNQQPTSSKQSRLQGWVTNLLIDPKYRGYGYAKILMAATEGIAKRWDCDCIYLHADADYRSGKVAQTLYQGLGYHVVTDTHSDYTWMGTENPFSSIRIIEGVPLLCFRKTLAPDPSNYTGSTSRT